MPDIGNLVGKSVADATISPATAKAASMDKLMSPHAVEDPETVTGDNPQKAWLGGSGKPMGPFGPKGRMF